MNSSSPFSFLSDRPRRRRSGVSPVIATTILLGITVALGLALWSFANAGVGTATQSYAETVTEYGRFAIDTFIVPSVVYDYANGATSANDITIYVYNSGRFETQITSAIITCRDCSTPPVGLTAYTFNAITVNVDPNNLGGDNLNPDGITQAGESIDGKVTSKNLKHLDFDTTAGGDIFRSGFTYQIQVISDTGAYQTIYQKY